MRVPALVAMLCTLAVPLRAAEPPLFQNTPTVRLATGTLFAARPADFNRDGLLDLALLRFEGNMRFEVHLGRGDGTFGDALVNREFTADASAMEIGDIDGDGILDVVGSSGWKGSGILLHALLGNGDGTFRRAGGTGSGSRPCDSAWFALADMTGDGRADIIACDVLVFPAIAGGNFAAPIVTEAHGAGRIHLLDANGDGRRDVFLEGSSLLLGNGDGTLQPPVPQPANGSAAVADFNGDGRDDMTWIDALLQERAFAFATPQGFTRVSAGFAPQSARVTAGDVNGDARPDVLMNVSGHVFVSTTRADGTSDPPRVYLAGTNAAVIAAGDFDSDGRADVLAVGAIDNARIGASLLHGNGDGTFVAERAYPFSRALDSYGAPALTAADYDRDGSIDVAVAAATLVTLHGDGAGAFERRTDTPLRYTPRRAAFGDFNGDGLPDAIVDGPECWLANGDGTFRKTGSGAFDPSLASTRWTLLTGDFNGDGERDIALVGQYSVYVYAGRGAGMFDPTPRETRRPGANPPWFLWPEVSKVTADIDGDGRDDILTSEAVWFGQADLSFRVVQSPLGYTDQCLLADLDGDGRSEIIGLTSDWPVALLTIRDAEFRKLAELELQSFGSLAGAVAADFDGDAATDLALGTTVLLGDGRGSFDGYARFRTFNSASALAAADVDGNGSDDLLVASADAGCLDVIRTRAGTSRNLPLPMTIQRLRNSEDISRDLEVGTPLMVEVVAAASSPWIGSGAMLFALDGRTTAITEVDRRDVDGRPAPAAAGPQRLTVTYSGDEIYAPAVASQNIVVQRGAVKWNVPSAGAPLYRFVGEPIRFTGHLEPRDRRGAPPLTGNVSIYMRGGVFIASVPAPDIAFELAPLPPGTYTIELRYSGDANYRDDAYSLTVKVSKRSTWLTLTADPPKSARPGTAVALRASLQDAPGATGIIRFTDGSRVLGDAPVAGGAATITTTLAEGRHTIQAQYLGDERYESSTATLTYEVVAASSRRRSVRR
ncbi:MAG TPA: FG-GAP-like repeat-containing protein [Thermoanaerobaculia bacterium]